MGWRSAVSGDAVISLGVWLLWSCSSRDNHRILSYRIFAVRGVFLVALIDRPSYVCRMSFELREQYVATKLQRKAQGKEVKAGNNASLRRVQPSERTGLGCSLGSIYQCLSFPPGRRTEV